MKKMYLLWVLLFSFSFLEAAIKIAYVNFEKVFEKYYKTEQINEELKKQTKEWQEQLDVRKKEISDLKDDYDKKEAKLSESERQEMRKKIMKKLQEFQELSQDLTKKLQKLQFDKYKKIEDDIINTIKKIQKQNKYDVVLDGKNVLAGGIDITDKVIKELNKGNK